MKTSLLKFAAAALLASSTVFAVPNPLWDLSGLFNVNSLGDPTVTSVAGTGDYKFEVRGGESGTTFLVNAFTTVISTDMFTVKTTWPSNVLIDIDTIYLKAGTQTLLWDVSNINWSLYDGFYVTQSTLLNPRGNAYLEISNETVDGGGGTSVPDGGTTAVLLGLGLLGLALLSRKKSALA